jgi:2-polyprenyl-3-methyl-5-hydroxy-6-metoxy-1,4-benzoquinol methylase
VALILKNDDSVRWVWPAVSQGKGCSSDASAHMNLKSILKKNPTIFNFSKAIYHAIAKRHPALSVPPRASDSPPTVSTPCSSQEFIAKGLAFKSELKKITGFDAALKLWRATRYPYSMRSVHPFSDDYKTEVLDIYESLSEKPYEVSNELTTPKQKSESSFIVGFPWNTGNLSVIGGELAKTLQALKCLENLGLKKDNSILEFGVGWGNLALPLARSGYNVTAIDIDQGFLHRLSSIAKNELSDIKTIHADFVTAARNVERSYNYVIFQSSFHHCLEFDNLLAIIQRDVLTADGTIIFLSEPIFDDYPFPWGLRFDGESLWAITCNSWLELGFKTSFFSELLMRHGFFLTLIPEIPTMVGQGYMGRRFQLGINFSDWILPQSFSDTFHLPDMNSAHKGRFLKRESQLPAVVHTDTQRSYFLTFKNFASVSLDLTVSDQSSTNPKGYTLKPNETLTINYPGKETVCLKSSTFVPSKLLNNSQDSRELGVSLEQVQIR